MTLRISSRAARARERESDVWSAAARGFGRTQAPTTKQRTTCNAGLPQAWRKAWLDPAAPESQEGPRRAKRPHPRGAGAMGQAAGSGPRWRGGSCGQLGTHTLTWSEDMPTAATEGPWSMAIAAGMRLVRGRSGAETERRPSMGCRWMQTVNVGEWCNSNRVRGQETAFVRPGLGLARSVGRVQAGRAGRKCEVRALSAREGTHGAKHRGGTTGF